ncbi:MAG: M24 family metallopeptidase [Bacteroidales bacterium]|nr:M24 family metallopeptidase [Bacteroidales bacterium]
MSRYKPIDSSLFSKNRKKLYQKISDPAIIVLFSAPLRNRSGDQYFPYRQNSDFFYLSGIEQENSILVFCPQHPDENFRETLFIPKPDEKTRIWQGDSINDEKAFEVSGIKNIKNIEDFNSYIKHLICFTNNVFISETANIKTDEGFEIQGLYLQKQFIEDNSYLTFHNLDPFLKDLRLVKENEEINLIKYACRITSDAFTNLCKIVKPNIYEYEVEASITHTFLSKGAAGHAYPSIVASGINACVLHYNNNSSLMKNGDLLLLDFGAEYANYAADCSRTIPVNGRFTERQLNLYNLVLSVFEKVKPEFKPGNTINKLNEIAGMLMQEELLRIGLISKQDVETQDEKTPAYKKYFMHGLTHFLGLDVHDLGDKDAEFVPGMVLTCEPGIYIPNENIGIRLENDILIGENDPIDLMENIPIYPEEIEDLMNS